MPSAAPRHFQLPSVATGTPSRRAASWPPTDSASLIASTLKSSVYCRFGSLLFRIWILHTAQDSTARTGFARYTLAVGMECFPCEQCAES